MKVHTQILTYKILVHGQIHVVMGIVTNILIKFAKYSPNISITFHAYYRT